MSPILRLALAVLGPIVVVGVAWRVLAVEETVEIGPLAQEFDKRVEAARGANVVVIGASFAHSDFDKAALSAAISPSAKPALILSSPSSSAPVWYAMLKERIYAHGLKPELVIIPVSVPTALTVRLLPTQAGRLTEQMPVLDDVVLARSYGALVPARVQQVLDRRATLRDPLLEQFRTAFPRLFFGADRTAVDNAGTAVFGEQHASADARAIPVVEARAAAAQDTSMAVEDPEASYLEDLANLVEEHGGQLAIVLPPQAPGTAGTRLYAPAIEGALVEWANRRGVGWIDLRTIGWDATHFSDELHMTPEAARTFSTMVGERLAAMGALTGEKLAAAVLPLVPASVRRVGDPPPLPAITVEPGKEPCVETIKVPGLEFLGWAQTGKVAAGIRSPLAVWEGDTLLEPKDGGQGCAGSWRQKDNIVARRRAADGPPLRVAWSESVPDRAGKDEFYWVFPGTAIEWAFEQPWSTTAGAPTVVGEVLAFGTGAAELVVGDRAAPFVSAGQRLRATIPAPTAAGAWQVAIRSPVGGPFLLVRRLRVEAGSESTPIVSDPPERQVDILGSQNQTVEGAPPAVGPFKSGKGDTTGWFVVPRLSYGNCTPYRVWKGDRPLDRATLGPRNGALPGIGGTRQVGDKLFFALSEGAPGELRVRLDEDRSCLAAATKGGGVSTWLYGGDHLRVDVPFPRRFALAGDVQRLILRGDPVEIEYASVQVGVRVTLGADVLVDQAIDLAALPAGVAVPLARPAPVSGKEAFVVELTMPTGAPPTMMRVRIADGGA